MGISAREKNTHTWFLCARVLRWIKHHRVCPSLSTPSRKYTFPWVCPSVSTSIFIIFMPPWLWQPVAIGPPVNADMPRGCCRGQPKDSLGLSIFPFGLVETCDHYSHNRTKIWSLVISPWPLSIWDHQISYFDASPVQCDAVLGPSSSRAQVQQICCPLL